MKRLTLIIACLGSLIANAQKITVKNPVVDLGQIAWKHNAYSTFELHNSTSRRATLRIEPDCYCTAVSFDTKELEGGASTKLTVIYDAQALGRFSHQIAVYEGKSKEPIWLTVKGDVRRDVIDYSDTYPVNLGVVRINKKDLEFDNVIRPQKSVQSINIVNPTRHDFTPNVMHLPPYLTATAVPDTLKAGEEGRIDFTLDPDKLASDGLTQTSVYLSRYPGDIVNDTTALYVSAIVLPAFNSTTLGHLDISSNILELDFAGKKQKTGTILLRNTGQGIVNITSMQMFTPGLQVTLSKQTLAPGNEAKLKVTGFSDQLLNTHTRPRILIITDDPQNQKIIIEVQAK